MLRVASVPSSHVYVRHLARPDPFPSVTPERAEDVVRLDDPVPKDGRKVPGGWWPPLMLEPGWVTDNHQRFDVFHVHFGFDALRPQNLADVVQELTMHDVPLVYTVHDLRNPHHPTPSAHQEQQDVLVAAARTLITLTPGAAEAIQARWGRSAHVLPHPHVLDADRITAPRPREKEFIVGVHVKSLRANMDPLAILDTLADAVADLPAARLQINVHDEIFDPANHWYAPQAGAALLAYENRPRVDVRVHPYFSDDQLWEYLSSLSVSVLPYRFGTHSGWLEACHDLGTAIIAPDCGFYHQQRPAEVFRFDEDAFDADSLRAAVHRTHDRWQSGVAAPRPTWEQRRSERHDLASAHARLYREALI